MSVPDKIIDTAGNTWVKIPGGILFTDMHDRVFHTPENRFVSYTILPLREKPVETNIKEPMPVLEIGDVFGVDEVDDSFIVTDFSAHKIWCVSKDQFNGFWGFERVVWVLRNGRMIWRRA